MNRNNIRVRLAPSPTGKITIGNLRTALYNYLFAKKHNGEFFLRIEDTDQKRFDPSAEQYIVEALKWLGIKPDAGFGFGGGEWGDERFYRQSFRNDIGIYMPYAQKLINSGHAYIAFDTEEELSAMRKRFKDEGYSWLTRVEMQNSLVLSDDIVQQRIADKEPYVIRFRNPGGERKIIVKDLIRGNVEFDSQLIDDKVLVKADGMPTYHLASVVDDFEMGITHVIRGAEWLSSAPLHVMLYEALGLGNDIPEFVHLPLILKPDGQGKLSKRDGIELGIPIFPFTWKEGDKTALGYKEEGFLPAAVINMMALLGWNPGDGSEKEIFSLDELIQEFSFEKVHLAGAKYNPSKAIWFNQQYIRNASVESLTTSFKEYLLRENVTTTFAFGDDYFEKVVKLMLNHVNFISEIYTKAPYMITRPYNFDDLKSNWNEEISTYMTRLIYEFNQILSDAFNAKNIEIVINKVAVDMGIKPKTVKQAFMVLLTGQKSGPPMYDVAEVLGYNEVQIRIINGVRALQNHSNVAL